MVISMARQVDIVLGHFRCHPTAGTVTRGIVERSALVQLACSCPALSLAFVPSSGGSKSLLAADPQNHKQGRLASFTFAPCSKVGCCTR
jgi:hypothetical protein